MKLQILITGVLLFFQSFLLAHNPSQSSLKLSLYEQRGILEVNLAQYGIEQALVKKYPDLDLASIDPKDFKELLITYLKENISIAVNGQALKIGKGAIKLGGHQTDLKFQVDNVPATPKYVEVEAPCFQENERQQNFFRVVYNELTTRKKLNKENDFKSKFTIMESAILVNDKTENSRSKDTFLRVATISFFSIFLFFIVRKRRVYKII